MLGLFAAVLPLVLHHSSPAPPTSEPSALRAQVWARVVAINDDSVRAYVADEQVVAVLDDGKSLPVVEYEVRADEFRNLRMLGEQHFYTPTTYEPYSTQKVEVSLLNGVQCSIAVEAERGLARPEEPAHLWCVTYPGVYMGLGRGINPLQLRTRAEHLLDAPDLHIIVESADGVELVGADRVDTRIFSHKVTLDPRTGDVLRHQVLDLEWGAPFVDWTTPHWTQQDGCRLPTKVGYQVYEKHLAKEDLTRLAGLVTAAGLAKGCQSPDSPDFPAWRRIRDDYFEGRGAPVRPAAPLQVCTLTYRSVNAVPSADWFALPSLPLAHDMMSAALEIQVDRLDLEPGPAPRLSVPAPAGKDSR